MRIRKNDTVLIRSGKDRGKQGKVLRVLPTEGVLLVEGLNIVKRHTKPRSTVRQAGIIQKEAPLALSKVELVCPKCGKPAKTGQKFLEDGKKVRVCKECLEVID